VTARVLAIPVQNVTAASDPAPDQEAAHLRRVIETQPSVLMRVAVDGQLLAANEVSLALLGAQELADVVGKSLTERIAPSHVTEWNEFAKRVWDGARGSIECDITTVSGAQRSVLLQAVPLLDHPDGIPSLLLTVRDVSANRRLETTLVEEHQLTTLLTSKADFARAEQQKTAAFLAQREAEYDRVLAERTAERDRLQQALAEKQGASQTFEREASELGAARAQLAAALAESAELKTSLERRQAEYQHLVAAQEAERAQLQQAAAAERDRAHGFEQQANQFADERAQLEAALEAAAEDTTDLKTLLQQHETTVKDLRNKLVNAAAERTRLTTLLEHRGAEDPRSTADRAGADRAREEAARALKAFADQKLELQILTQNIRTLEPLAATGRLAAEVRAELQEFLAQIEQRAGRLIERCSLESIDRREIESLRIDTARAASLARQMISPKTNG
jgi:PAS domain S-box-containing protein